MVNSNIISIIQRANKLNDRERTFEKIIRGFYMLKFYCQGRLLLTKSKLLIDDLLYIQWSQ